MTVVMIVFAFALSVVINYIETKVTRTEQTDTNIAEPVESYAVDDAE